MLFSIQAKTFFVREAFCQLLPATNLAIRRNNKEIFNEKIHPAICSKPAGSRRKFCLDGSHGRT
jgi:hypothetical protein